MNNIPIETERKFLIRIPIFADLEKQSNFRTRSITQTYLQSDANKSARVRKIIENDEASYVKTIKERISVLSCYEDEHFISLDEYKSLLLLVDKEKKSIHKTRYSFEYCNHILEIDVYDFWNDRATLEIELKDENEQFSIPTFIEIIKEISTDGRYKNTNLAKSVPFDEI
jgi:CYTH domain-containing protein